jgi:DNA repair protein RecN (Recombination protein N)
MLKHLHVVNYALINKLEVTFEKGFTVITGETGAGKSIILGALGLVLGNRADTNILLDQNQKCIVEGHFRVENHKLQSQFDKYQLDYSHTSIFRREISPNGRSRAFINDTPVSLEVMREIASKLINIHSQHHNLLIGNTSFQFDVVDGFAQNLDKVFAYREDYKQLTALKKELEELELEERKLKTDLDYYKFQYNELEVARLDSEGFSKVEKDLEILQNSEEIKLALEKSAYLLSKSEENVVSTLKEVLNLLKQISNFSDEYKVLVSRIESVFIEIKDLNTEIEHNSDRVSSDPALMAELQGKVDLVNKLLLKHGVREVFELEDIRDTFLQKIEGIGSFEEKITLLRAAISQKEKNLKDLANQISKMRSETSAAIETNITGILQKLGMPGAMFVVSIAKGDQLTINGFDSIDFLFSANPDGEPREISKIASGGEISRLMLAVKSLISQKSLLPTIIFDEIDTGVSGETANRVADILDSISKKMQVIAITHLPQIASKGTQHLMVRKNLNQNKTTSTILELNESERIEEIAKMLGGNNPTQAMKTTARELITQK